MKSDQLNFKIGSTVNILGTGNSYKTTIALRAALQRVIKRDPKEPASITFFDGDGAMSSDVLPLLFGYKTMEECAKAHEDYNFKTTIIDSCRRDDKTEHLFEFLDRATKQEDGEHYIIVDNVEEFSRNINIDDFRKRLRDYATSLNGLIFLVSHVGTILSMKPEDIQRIRIFDADTLYDAGSILLTSGLYAEPITFVIKSDAGESGVTYSFNETGSRVTDETHPHLADIGVISSGPGISRMLIPRQFAGWLGAPALRSDSREFVSSMCLSQECALDEEKDLESTAFNFNTTIYFLPKVDISIIQRRIDIRYPSFINARNRRKNK